METNYHPGGPSWHNIPENIQALIRYMLHLEFFCVAVEALNANLVKLTFSDNIGLQEVYRMCFDASSLPSFIHHGWNSKLRFLSIPATPLGIDILHKMEREARDAQEAMSIKENKLWNRLGPVGMTGPAFFKPTQLDAAESHAVHCGYCKHKKPPLFKWRGDVICSDCLRKYKSYFSKCSKREHKERKRNSNRPLPAPKKEVNFDKLPPTRGISQVTTSDYSDSPDTAMDLHIGFKWMFGFGRNW